LLALKTPAEYLDALPPVPSSMATVIFLPHTRLRYPEAMEVHFTPEQEAQLAQIATTSGTDAAHLVKDAALRLIEDARFRAAVCEGMAQGIAGSLSTKKRWTLAWSGCCTRSHSRP